MGINHLILCRFGSGQRSTSFYESRLYLFRQTLYASLMNQTDKNFTFVLLLNSGLKNEVEGQLRELIESANFAFKIIRHDPFSNFNLMPELGVIIEQSCLAPGPVIYTRVDGDDCIAPNFNERVLGMVASDVSEPFLIRFTSGAMYYFGKGLLLGVEKKNYSIVSLVNPDPGNDLWVFSFSHTSIDSIMADLNFRVIALSTPEPMWVRGMHLGSDSNAGLEANRNWAGSVLLRNVRSFLARYILKRTGTAIYKKLALGWWTGHNFNQISFHEDKSSNSDEDEKVKSKLAEMGIKSVKSTLKKKALILELAKQESARNQVEYEKLKKLFYLI